jgi:hypothetical protein
MIRRARHERHCDAANVTPLAPLFAVTGSAAVQTETVAVPHEGTPN